MNGRNYIGSLERTFKAAVMQVLETDYGLIGSRRVREMLAEDVQSLAQQFFPQPDHLSSGWMLLTGTKAEGKKHGPNKTAGQYTLVTIPWPVLLTEDVERLSQMPPGQAGKEGRQQLLKERLVRILEHGWHHPLGPVLLTLSDLALLVGSNTVQVSQLLTQARQETGKPLLTKGYYFDQGVQPTHKAEIVRLYEQGFDEADIARRTNHAQSSVGHYLRDYGRVKELLKLQTPCEEMPPLLDLRPSVVKAHLALLAQFHPHLVSDSTKSYIGS